jgi:Uma2 family endonuclease
MNNPRRAMPQSGERMTVQEYFQLDYTVPNERYEYQDGVIRLREGATVEHCEITGNMLVVLHHKFQEGPCFVRSSDMRVQVSETAYFFPDLTVSCSAIDRRRGNTLIRSPRIVVEVLSPSTEKTDRTDKLQAYQTCPTIQEIVLIDQFRPYVEVYRRIEEDSTEWSHVVYESGEEVILESVDVYIPMEDIYRKIDFNEPLVEE